MEGADECSAAGCARVPPRNLVNCTYCGHPLRQTTHCDSVSWRVVALKSRHVRDDDPGFSAAPSRGFRLVLSLTSPQDSRILQRVDITCVEDSSCLVQCGCDKV
ncbi:hypothetical protein Y032_0154g3000 [Ancylostoma ceylanicum]|uniref:Uncharacterized protein n=1 Tax=Ancylostoma ceylanicum TaxID=53326 RepID=A0A016T0A1_9BILA|nr:hypothetical protein Y032_0154g3000 [Ancylostoma ceylanicum]